MATISVPYVLQSTQLDTLPRYTSPTVYHPPHAFPCSVCGESVQGVQKQAAENFNWG